MGALDVLETWEEASWGGAWRACVRGCRMWETAVLTPSDCQDTSHAACNHPAWLFSTVGRLCMTSASHRTSRLDQRWADGFPSSSIKLSWATCSYGQWRRGIAAGEDVQPKMLLYWSPPWPNYRTSVCELACIVRFVWTAHSMKNMGEVGACVAY